LETKKKRLFFSSSFNIFSVEEPEHLSSDLLAPRLLVVHDPGARREHDDAEQAGREQPRDLFLKKNLFVKRKFRCEKRENQDEEEKKKLFSRPPSSKKN